MKKKKSDLLKILKVNSSGLNIHRDKSNGNYKDGNRISGSYPCPICNEPRNCEKRNSWRKCWKCHANRPSMFSYKEWHKKTKKMTKKWAIDYKGGKCSRCGIMDLDTPAFHFHHIDPATKEDNPGHLMRQKPSDRLRIELDKCILLCANCHAIITWGEEV